MSEVCLYYASQSFTSVEAVWNDNYKLKCAWKKKFCAIFKFQNNVPYIWLSHVLALSVPDERYSRSVSCALILIFTFLFESFEGTGCIHVSLNN